MTKRIHLTELPDENAIMRYMKESVGEKTLKLWLSNPDEYNATCEAILFESYNLEDTPQKVDFTKKIAEYNYSAEEIIEQLPELRLLYVTGQL